MTLILMKVRMMMKMKPMIKMRIIRMVRQMMESL